MKMKKFINGIVVVSIIIVIAIIICNLHYNREEFLKTNIINCINTIIVIGISFFIVQRQNDYRKQKEIFITLLEKIKNLIEDENSYNFTNMESREILMRMRDISLKVDLISTYSKRFNIMKDVKFLEEKFEEYKSVIDNHITQIDLLRQLQSELQRPLNLMSQKIFEIMLNLYK